MAIAQPHSSAILFRQVLGCNFDNATMQEQSGSVDTPATQRGIVNVMEGRTEAFNKRKEIYQLWMSHNSYKYWLWAKTAAALTVYNTITAWPTNSKPLSGAPSRQALPLRQFPDVRNHRLYPPRHG